MPHLAHTGRRGRVALTALAVALVALTATAMATVTLYQNAFSSRPKARQLQHAHGKHCDKAWLEKRKLIEVTVKRGPDACTYTPPVVADSSLPDQGIEATMKISKDTAKSVRDSAYVSLGVRVGPGKGYELRVTPKSGNCTLRRRPSGSGFPVDCSSNAIKGIDQRNLLRLQAFGSTVRGFVNGKKIVDVRDSHPGAVKGRRLEITVGNSARSSNDVVGDLDDVTVFCANSGC